jgi:molybdate transport system substrate-binding protein
MKSLVRAPRLAWAGRLAAAVVLLMPIATAHAVELKVLSGNGMKAILGDLTGEFERTTGHKLVIAYATAGLMKDRIRAGEVADVAVMQRYLLDDLLQQGRIVPSSTIDIAHSPIGVFGRVNLPKPDISSVEGLKRALLAAKSITYTDPVNGGLSGSFFPTVLERLGIAEQMKPKTRLGSPGERVSTGEVELGVLQISEILPLTGVQLIGPLPEQLQGNIAVSAAVISGAHQPDAGTTLIKFLSSPAAAAVIKAHGMEPY